MNAYFVVAFINEQNEADARLFTDSTSAQEVFDELADSGMVPEIFQRFVEDE